MSILYNVAHHPATGENANLHMQNYDFYLIQASKWLEFYSYLQETNVWGKDYLRLGDFLGTDYEP